MSALALILSSSVVFAQQPDISIEIIENLDKLHLLPKFIENAFVELEAAVFDNR